MTRGTRLNYVPPIGDQPLDLIEQALVDALVAAIATKMLEESAAAEEKGDTRTKKRAS